MQVRHVAGLAFAVVAMVAAAISYDHVYTLVAGDTGNGPWWAWMLPLSIDGLLVAGSLALWMERREGGRGGVLAWTSVVLGLLASLAANLASTRADWIPPEWVMPALAVWPPVALALAFELLVRVRRTGQRPVQRTVAELVSAPAERHPKQSMPARPLPAPVSPPKPTTRRIETPKPPESWEYGIEVWQRAVAAHRAGMGRPTLEREFAFRKPNHARQVTDAVKAMAA